MTAQTEMEFADRPNARRKCAADRTLPSWLGLVTSHRRLFDAGQDGWLRPLPGSRLYLGQEGFVSEEFSAGRNVIPVRLAFDVNELPFPDARANLAPGAAANGDTDGPPVVRWRTPIPLYAVKTVEVASVEQKTRLSAMASQFSNVSLPDTEIVVSDFAVPSVALGGAATWETESLELPESLNAVQGAMTMAVWAVPHVEPWIEVLQRALGGDATGVAERTGRLDAQWLRLPWLGAGSSDSAHDDSDGQYELWRAALRCMEWSSAASLSADALAEKIAHEASVDGARRTAGTWLGRTRRIVAAEETIACDDWRRNGAGLAVRLALLRPDPIRFKDWNRDLAGLPPGVWWAASILCGWRRGYRDLDRRFRGDAALQEFLATRALAASWPEGDAAALPPSQSSSLERKRTDGCFTLTWRGRPVVRKHWHSRAKWYGTDLAHAAAGKAAADIAGRLGWPCIERRLSLPEGRVRTTGGGRLLVDGDTLVVEGEMSLRLPDGVDVGERLDADEFRRRLATEAGVVPDPPEGFRRWPATEVVAAPGLADASAFGLAIEPRGLIYRPDFITEEEETRWVGLIDGAEWNTELKRRVQHYGWRYDYGKRRIDEDMRLGELPEWAQELGRRLVNEGLMKDRPDQLIVNEYEGEQGIAAHVDKEDIFAERIATVSLIETWGMVFRRRDSKEKVEKALERLSVAVLTGDARYKWTHEIPKRKNEWREDRSGKRRRVKRGRRISLTFRTTRPRRTA